MLRSDRQRLVRYLRDFEQAVRADEMVGMHSPELTRPETSKQLTARHDKIMKFVAFLVDTKETD